MRILIRNIPSTILLQTVFLTPKDENTVLFRCYHCGTAIARIQGEVAGIAAGFIPNGSVPVISQCFQCKESYSFLTVPKSKDNKIALVLSPEPNRDVSTFHCIICRTPLAQYGNGIVATLPGVKVITIPAPIICTKPDCQKHYLLNEIVSLVV